MQPVMDPNFLAIQNQVNLIWNEFDTDKNGYLDRSETKKFVAKTLFNLNSTGDLDD